MAIEAVSTAVTTGPTASGGTHDLGIPEGGSAGEVILMGYGINNPSRTITIPSWSTTDESGSGSITQRIGWATRITGGSETSPVTATLNTGTAQMASVAQRFSGVDTADPHNSNNYVSGDVGSATSTVSISSGTLTGLETGSGVLVVITCDASRSVSSAGTGLTDLGSSSSGFVNAVMLYDEDAGGSSNPAYSITMSGTRAYNWFLIELKAASAGTPVAPIAMHHLMRMKRK